MMNAKKFLTGVLSLFGPLAPCVALAESEHQSYHAIDTAVLYPNDEPQSLMSVVDFPWLQNELPKLMDQHFGKGAAAPHSKQLVLSKHPVFEVASELCLRNPLNWRVVAVRLVPFASLAFGDAHSLDERAAQNRLMQHRRVPQLRLTFQPFCRMEDKNTQASDAALHVVFNTFTSKFQSRTHERLWRRLRDGLVAADERRLSRERVAHYETQYLNFISERHTDLAIEGIVAISRSLRNMRLVRKVSVVDSEAQFSSILSDIGVVQRNNEGVSSRPLVHPLFRDKGDQARLFLDSKVKELALKKNLFQVRMMSLGDGQQLKIFSSMEVEAKSENLIQVPIDLFATQEKSGLPERVMRIGNYDFLPLESTTAFRTLSKSKQQAIAQSNVLFDVQEPLANSRLAVIMDTRLNDPMMSHSSTQSCLNCHGSQERMSMALRVAIGSAPRKFGYFFRAFGYVSNVPFVSRRLIEEARFMAQQANRWDLKHVEVAQNR